MNRLKELRKGKGLTQKTFSKEIGIPLRTLQNWENGESNIKPEKAEMLADYFDVNVSYLLGYSDFNFNIFTGLGQRIFGTDLDEIKQYRTEYFQELKKRIEQARKIDEKLRASTSDIERIKVLMSFFEAYDIEESWDILKYAQDKFDKILFRDLAEYQSIMETAITSGDYKYIYPVQQATPTNKDD